MKSDPRRDPADAERAPAASRTPSVPRAARALAPRDRPPRGEAPADDPDAHGVTAEDAGGVGAGEEGFRAEDYPGDNPLRGESEREHERRHAYAWSWPVPPPHALAHTGTGAAADRRICEEIGRRILRAEPDLRRVVVRVLDGAVTLDGEVRARQDERVVEALAQGVAGVRSVRSAIAVRSAD